MAYLRWGIATALVGQLVLGACLVIERTSARSSPRFSADVDVVGSRVTMRGPRASGRLDDGSIFEVRAGSATLEMHKPSALELADVALTFRQPARPGLRIVSKYGTLDQSEETLALDQTTAISELNGRSIGVERIVIDLRDGRLLDLRPGPLKGSDSALAMLIAMLLKR